MDKKHGMPSAYTILYWLIQDKKIEPEFLFNCLELVWPTFIKQHGYFFLKESFSEEEYKRLINENSNPEYWINLLTIDDFFSELDDWKEKSSIFAATLVSMWAAKLKQDFPNVHFTVEYVYNEETGDYGLTFYQNNKNNIQKLYDTRLDVPNIKESRIEQSSSGPRPGFPKIRKPRSDEMP